MTNSTDASPRTRHYGHFYGLDEPAGDDPVALVIGNCQAESLRIVLDGGGLRTVRTPAVHELVASDLPHLDRWLARASVLVSQPVRDDYHDLPLGTAQLASRLGPAAEVVTVPVIRFAGLYPAHAIIRPPSDPSLVPPVVAYHDLRVLAEAADRAAGRPSAARPELTPDAVRSIAQQSLGELRRRESANDTVPVADLFDHPVYDQMRTLNHPGNPVWSAVARRVHERLGLSGAPTDPGRPLLASVHAPREQVVIDTWGLDDEPDPDWVVEGERVPGDAVRDAHLDWYARHPDVVTTGLARHRDALQLLGLA